MISKKSFRSIAIAAAFSFTAAGCTDSKTATQVLSDQGYTDIHLTGYKPWSCSDDDTFATGFTAHAPSGRNVSGTVCNAFLKGATIRFDH